VTSTSLGLRHLAFAALLALADLSSGDSFAAFARAAFRAICSPSSRPRASAHSRGPASDLALTAIFGACHRSLVAWEGFTHPHQQHRGPRAFGILRIFLDLLLNDDKGQLGSDDFRRRLAIQHWLPPSL
jgi:hypothetical protein